MMLDAQLVLVASASWFSTCTIMLSMLATTPCVQRLICAIMGLLILPMREHIGP